MKQAFVAAIFLATSALTASLILSARGPDPNEVPSAREVSERTMSPFCPGLTLSECPSPQSAELRGRVAAKVKAGWTNQQIDDWLVQSYGQSILGRPRGVLPYVVPTSVVLVGAVSVTVLTLRWSRARRLRESLNVPEIEIDDKERARLDREIKDFQRGTE